MGVQRQAASSRFSSLAAKDHALYDYPAINKKLDVEILTERSAMLADVAHAIAQMKHDLADLLRALR